MGGRFRNAKRKPARGKPRNPKRRFLLVCEGEKTERQYFLGFVKKFRSAVVEVVVHPHQGAPVTLVELAQKEQREAKRRAKSENDANLLFEEVWCVFDVDVHERIPEALDTARQSSICCAVSNPCFELWLLLHFTRMMQVLKRAAKRPIGYVDSAVMLNAKLKPGVTLLHVVAMTRSLGELKSVKDQQPEQYRWTDGTESQVTCEFRGGKLVRWDLVRPAPVENPAVLAQVTRPGAAP